MEKKYMVTYDDVANPMTMVLLLKTTHVINYL